MSQCFVPGCRSPRTLRGHYCNTHKSNLRRHGDAQQRSVTVAQLAPYAKIVRAHVRRNARSPLWGQLDGLWLALVEDCESELQEYREGTANARHRMQAMAQLVQLKEAVPPRAVWEIVLAMFVLLEFEERRFRSDDAFRFQLVRRVRGLSELNVGSVYKHESRTVKRVYRDLSPRAIAVMADLLIQSFGQVSVHVARLENHRWRQGQAAAQNIDHELTQLL